MPRLIFVMKYCYSWKFAASWERWTCVYIGHCRWMWHESKVPPLLPRLLHWIPPRLVDMFFFCHFLLSDLTHTHTHTKFDALLIQLRARVCTEMLWYLPYNHLPGRTENYREISITNVRRIWVLWHFRPVNVPTGRECCQCSLSIITNFFWYPPGKVWYSDSQLLLYFVCLSRKRRNVLFLVRLFVS